MHKVKWGIIGPGKIARKFASDFRFSKYAELAGVASMSNERARIFADDFNIKAAYGNYNELLNDSSIDVIYIATPNHLHYANSLSALNKGKAVLCEKPLTCNLNDTSSLLNFASDSKVYLMEGMWTWFLPAIRKAKQWIDEGRIGKIRQIKADFGFKAPYDPNSRLFDPELGGGSMLDIGIYPIAFSYFLLKSKPKIAFSRIERAPTGVDKDVFAILQFDEVNVQIGCSFSVDLPNYAFVIGDNGYIEIPDFWRSDRCYIYTRDKLIDEYIANRHSFGYNYEIDAVSKELLDGKLQSDVFNHDDSYAISKIMDSIIVGKTMSNFP